MPDLQTQNESPSALPNNSYVTLPIVAIVGRPNVGKSSLFNRILGRRHAIVSEVSGTTRDRLISEVEWDDRRFILIDTGGLESKPEGPIRERVQEQADMAVADADVIIFLTDVTEGLTVNDLAAVERLRRSLKPVILAVNKVDNESREFSASEFYQLGLQEPLLISAYHNRGVYPLMDQVLALLPTPPEVAEDWDQDSGSESSDLKIAIIGRTNVGKSMLMNSILGQERSIVTPEAGTTRDALDTYMSYDGHDVTLIDTAGMRRRGLVQRGIEKFSVIRAVNAVGRSEITLLVIDATELATAQDSHIAGLAWEMCRGLVVVPIVFTSALHGRGIDPLMRTVLELQQERSRFVPARELQYVMARALASHSPPPVKGHSRERVYFSRLRQVGINPPTFLFTVDKPWLVHFSYERYLENQIRNNFGFDHTHLKLVFKKA